MAHDTTSWADVRAAAPDLAARVQARFDATGLGLIATLRADGAPRISGIEPLFGDDHVWLGMMADSRKVQDLQRDGRCALHAATVDKEMSDGDAKLSATAVEERDPQARKAYIAAFANATGQDLSAFGDFPVFRLDISSVVFLSVAPERDALLIEHWAPGRPVTVTRRT